MTTKAPCLHEAIGVANHTDAAGRVSAVDQAAGAARSASPAPAAVAAARIPRRPARITAAGELPRRLPPTAQPSNDPPRGSLRWA